MNDLINKRRAGEIAHALDLHESLDKIWNLIASYSLYAEMTAFVFSSLKHYALKFKTSSYWSFFVIMSMVTLPLNFGCPGNVY